MIVIGLTGPSGCGKGAVGMMLQERGIPVLDTDRIYHEITGADGPCMEELTAEFGSEIRRADGSLNRSELAKIVFCGGEEQQKRCKILNAVTHKYVLREVRVQIAYWRAHDAFAVAVDAPMLYESGFDRECDSVLAVISEKAKRLARICARDGISSEAAEARFSAQKCIDFYRDAADYVIENNGTLAELSCEVERYVCLLHKR